MQRREFKAKVTAASGRAGFGNPTVAIEF